MEKRISLCRVLLYFLYAMQGHSVLVSTMLTDVAVSPGLLADTLTWYFEQTPSCIYEPNDTILSSEVEKRMELFLPLAALSSSCKQKVADLVSSKNNQYRVCVVPVAKPLKGIKIIIWYNPHSISCNYEITYGFEGEKMLNITLGHKKLLQAVNDRTCSLRWYG